MRPVHVVSGGISWLTNARPDKTFQGTIKEADDAVLDELETDFHAFTVCHFGSEKFPNKIPFVLALIEYEGADPFVLNRPKGVDPEEASLDWIGMEVKPRFLRNCTPKPTDVYSVPA